MFLVLSREHELPNAETICQKKGGIGTLQFMVGGFFSQRSTHGKLSLQNGQGNATDKGRDRTEDNEREHDLEQLESGRREKTA